MSSERANTPEKKLAIIHRILAVWAEYPDLRLGQLILNSTDEHVLWNIEDYPLIREIEEFGEHYR